MHEDEIVPYSLNILAYMIILSPIGFTLIYGYEDIRGIFQLFQVQYILALVVIYILVSLFSVLFLLANLVNFAKGEFHFEFGFLLVFTLAAQRLRRIIFPSSVQEENRERLQYQLRSLTRDREREDDKDARANLDAEIERIQNLIDPKRAISIKDNYGATTKDWKEILAATRERLINESDRLQTRSRANLGYGFSISVIGVVSLIAIIIFPANIQNDAGVIEFLNFLPRLSIVIIIQVIGAFFLRMYVSNENDLKQNKNEITNIEIRIAACLIGDDTPNAKQRISEILVQEERNFILKKGEKTAGEAWKAEVSDLKDFYEAILQGKTAKPTTSSK